MRPRRPNTPSESAATNRPMESARATEDVTENGEARDGAAATAASRARQAIAPPHPMASARRTATSSRAARYAPNPRRATVSATGGGIGWFAAFIPVPSGSVDDYAGEPSQPRLVT